MSDQDLALLRELLNRRPQGTPPAPGMPPVPAPPMFVPPIEVRGDQPLAKAVHKLEGDVPTVKYGTRRVTTEPPHKLQDFLVQSLLDKSVKEVGSFNPNTSWVDVFYGASPGALDTPYEEAKGTVHINRERTSRPIDLWKTVAHEMGHHMGIRHPSVANPGPNTEQIEELIRRIYFPDEK